MHLSPRKSELGMSLTSVLVALGLSGIVAAVLVNQNSQQLAMQRNRDQLAQRSALVEEIRGAFSFPDVCLRNLSGFDAAGGGKRKLSKVLSADGATTLFEVGKTYNDNLIRLTDLTISDAQAISSSGGQLTLTIETGKVKSKGVAAMGSETKKHTLRLFFGFDADDPGTITSCGFSPPARIGSMVRGQCTTRYPSSVNRIPCGIEAKVQCQPGEIALTGGSYKASNIALQASQVMVDAKNVPVGWHTRYVDTGGSCGINWAAPSAPAPNYCFNGWVQSSGAYYQLCGAAMVVCCPE